MAPAPGSSPGQAFPTLKLTPTQLVELAPRLQRYVEAELTAPTWADIVNAAEWLAGELGVSQTLWRHACLVMSRDRAAVALAFVTTRPEGHFTSGPAGYFAGMVRKDEKGELHLDRTLWKLREDKWGKPDRRRTH